MSEPIVAENLPTHSTPALRLRERLAVLARSAPVLVPLFFLIVVVDQVTKYLILQRFVEQERLPVLPGFFDLVLFYNKGIAFSFFASMSDDIRTIVLTMTTLGALTLVIYFLITDYFDKLTGQIALVLVLGGAVGNIVDRWQHGAVVDFLFFYYGTLYWPAFNVADSCIVSGVALLLLWPSKKKVSA